MRRGILEIESSASTDAHDLEGCMLGFRFRAFGVGGFEGWGGWGLRFGVFRVLGVFGLFGVSGLGIGHLSTLSATF